MGFSYAKKAGDTLSIIEEIGLKQTGLGNGFKDADGQEFFFEVTRRDRNDNGLAGSIHRMLPNNMARKAGTFLIDRDGRIVRGPKIWKEWAGRLDHKKEQSTQSR